MQSLPFVNKDLIKKITKKIKNKEFSKFVGSPEVNYEKYLDKSSHIIKNIRSSKSFFGGKSVITFEAKWSKVISSKYCISVNSATSAITTAIMACDIGPGDEVICTPFTFTASAAAIVAANAIPIFCDIDINTFCLDPKVLKSLISSKTKAVLSVHWNSNAGDLNEIDKICKDNKIYHIEDASQCHGSKYNNKFLGTIGDVGVFSFNEPKNLMTGEGGMIVTNNKNIAKKSRLIRNHGENLVSSNLPKKDLINIIGYNFRLPEILAEIGVHQIKNMKFLNNIRLKNYKFLIRKLKRFEEVLKPQLITNSDYYPYTVAFRVESKNKNLRKNLLAYFKKKKISITSGFHRLVSEHPLFEKKIGYGKNNCPYSCHLYNKEYKIGNLEVAKRLNNFEYIGFYQIGWPSNLNNMKKIVNTFCDFFEKYNK
jgi:perosamine synthetase